jgi:hypothetical protein
MNIELLEKYTHALCLMTTDQVFDHLKVIGFTIHHPTSKTKRYAVRQGSSLNCPLIVAHADTVLGSKAYDYSPETNVVTSAELDDRLGIAIMLCLLLDGIDISCLVCDNEEIGQTTARVFVKETTLRPCWLTEFDRRGTDVVCYDYETPLLVSMLEHVGFVVGEGSFSDIKFMQQLGVIGFNVGVGYHREHSLSCHANLNDTLLQVERWLTWLTWMNGVRLTHEEITCDNGHYYVSSYRSESRSESSFVERYESKIIDNPRIDDCPMDDDLFDSVDDDNDGWYVCDCCGVHCNDECDGCNAFHNGAVCDSCCDSLKGTK